MLSQNTEIVPRFKSIRLTSEELTRLKEFVSAHPNQSVAAEAIGLRSRDTLGNIMRNGRASSGSLHIIRKKLMQS